MESRLLTLSFLGIRIKLYNVCRNLHIPDTLSSCFPFLFESLGLHVYYVNPPYSVSQPVVSTFCLTLLKGAGEEEHSNLL